MATTVTIKGQVAIPKAVRELLGIKPGSKVDFRRTGSGIVEIRRADSKPVRSRFRICAAMPARASARMTLWR